METAVLLPVPEAEDLVGSWRAQGDPSAARGIPAHVTLLHPFVPAAQVDAGVIGELGWYFASVDSFEVDFGRVARFPDGRVVHLVPDGDDLDQLVASLARRWPEHPPYGGAHDPVVAHLTVVDTDDEALRAAAEAQVAAALPLTVRVEQAELWSAGADGRWSRTAVFALGEE